MEFSQTQEFDEELSQLDTMLDEIRNTKKTPLELIPEMIMRQISMQKEMLLMRRELTSFRNAEAAREAQGMGEESQPLLSGPSQTKASSSTIVPEVRMVEYCEYEKDGKTYKMMVPKFLEMELDACQNPQAMARRILSYYHPLEHLATVTLTGSTRIPREGLDETLLSPTNVLIIIAVCKKKLLDKDGLPYKESEIRGKITKVLSEIHGDVKGTTSKAKRKNNSRGSSTLAKKTGFCGSHNQDFLGQESRSQNSLGRESGSQNSLFNFNPRYHSTQQDNVIDPEDY